jgi:hypothetical protein
MMRYRCKWAFRLSLAFVLGSVATGYGGLRLYLNSLDRQLYVRPAIDTVHSLAVLQRLRTGHTGAAIELVEWQLDDGLVGLSGLADGQRNPGDCVMNIPAVLAMARTYRGEYPRSTAVAEIDDLVAKALNMAPAPAVSVPMPRLKALPLSPEP